MDCTPREQDDATRLNYSHTSTVLLNFHPRDWMVYDLFTESDSTWLVFPDGTDIWRYSVNLDSAFRHYRYSVTSKMPKSISMGSQRECALLFNDSLVVIGEGFRRVFSFNDLPGHLAVATHRPLVHFHRSSTTFLQVVDYDSVGRSYLYDYRYILAIDSNNVPHLVDIRFPALFGNGRHGAAISYLSRSGDSLLVSCNWEESAFIVDSRTLMVSRTPFDHNGIAEEALPSADTSRQSLVETWAFSEKYLAHYGKCFYLPQRKELIRLYYPYLPSDQVGGRYLTNRDRAIDVLLQEVPKGSGALHGYRLPTDRFYVRDNWWSAGNELVYVKWTQSTTGDEVYLLERVTPGRY
jgi:hypothetical protein